MIETSRLHLRPMTEADLALITPGLANFNVSRNTGRIPHPYTLADAEDYFIWLQTLAPGSLSLCIHVKNGPRAIGGIGYQLVGAETVPELGYWLAEDMWGKGYGFEAAQAMAGHAFSTGCHKALKASCHVENDASRRILARLGFVETGRTRTLSQAQGRDVATVTLELRAPQAS